MIFDVFCVGGFRSQRFRSCFIDLAQEQHVRDATRPGLFAETLDGLRPFLYVPIVFGEQAVFILTVQHA